MHERPTEPIQVDNFDEQDAPNGPSKFPSFDVQPLQLAFVDQSTAFRPVINDVVPPVQRPASLRLLVLFNRVREWGHSRVRPVPIRIYKRPRQSMHMKVFH